jgi:ABC-type dipeptide/oligopeptide/nickel transport system permease component
LSLRFFAKRIGLGLLTLFLVSVVVFFATQALPGNAAAAILGKQATPSALAALSKQLHLNESVFSQYLHWLSGIVQGNLGTSAATQQSVGSLISGRILNSGFLVLVSALVALPLSLALGVLMARLKGLSERTVIWRHAVPNAIVPAIQVSALQLAWMAGGVVVVEYVFTYPGIGSAMISAVTERDLPTVQALALIIAAVYVVVNLAADVATILITPRLRTAGR